jgi:hypothetical protein
MRVFAILMALAVLPACSRDPDVSESTKQCMASSSKSYDEKNFDQCVAACIKCEKGVTTTCSTACRLRGAK